MPADQAAPHVAHAWFTYQHAHYAQIVRVLPTLLDAAHGRRDLLVPTYRITAAVLVKLGEPDLAWLAADRAVTTAGDPAHAATATIAVSQALRALGRHRLALTAARAAADATTDDAVRGTLLLHAGLAAAGCGDRRHADDLTDRAAVLADRCATDDDRHHTAFGPTTVLLARFLTALELGESTEAVTRHGSAIRADGWSRLPVEHRAAHLVDAARAHLGTGDLTAAARVLVEADRIAPAEVRCRPVARTLVAEIARCDPAAADVARIAAMIGLTR
ncbi:XRE family transcriptional regulator [Micromonospora sp. NPDC018662]|uniref:XRE family transcriptional regulator n=1 Tax=Micromonospora sp. NPDC018662 TaxID=3364238 RepID=UPI0037B58575